MNTIIQRLQSHTVSIYHLTDDIVEEQIVDAKSLLTPSRFDLFAKLYYIKNRKENPTEAEKIYKEHIKAFNPDLREPGRDDKNGLDDFVSSFNQLIDQFDSQDFNTNISLVPVTEDDVILDGAHRVAALAYYDRKVGIARCKDVKPKADFDFQYFKNRGLSWDTMDVIANEMMHWVPKMYVACLWPKMKNKTQAVSIIEKKFDVVYEKSLKVNLATFKLLIQRVYDSQPWANAPESVCHKSLQCYDFNGQISFLFFVANSLEEVLAVKDEIRGIYGAGKHSLHITDNVEETKAIAKMVLLQDERNKWYGSSAINGLREKIEERLFYFKKVQYLKIKIAIAKIVGRG